MSVRVSVHPDLLRWAADRCGKSWADLTQKFPGLTDWMSRQTQPTLKQLEDFAATTHTAVGYLFLTEPPNLPLPVPDYRTVGSRHPGQPSPDLLDTLYLCQRRQDWYRQHMLTTGEPAAEFVGSLKTSASVVQSARTIRETLRFSVEERTALSDVTTARRHFRNQAEAIGVLVMSSSIVGSNSHRPLDLEEFRGFALADPLAPLVFINAADTHAGRTFTLAHELAHLWLGASGVSDVTPRRTARGEIEKWCNRVAAELLVPLAHLRQEHQPLSRLDDELRRLGRIYKVSTLVLLQRLYHARLLSADEFRNAYARELEILKRRKKQSGGGGDFYRTAVARSGERFATALVGSVWEGRTSFTEASRHLGVKKSSTFQNLSEHLGVLR